MPSPSLCFGSRHVHSQPICSPSAFDLVKRHPFQKKLVAKSWVAWPWPGLLSASLSSSSAAEALPPELELELSLLDLPEEPELELDPLLLADGSAFAELSSGSASSSETTSRPSESSSSAASEVMAGIAAPRPGRAERLGFERLGLGAGKTLASCTSPMAKPLSALRRLRRTCASSSPRICL